MDIMRNMILLLFLNQDKLETLYYYSRIKNSFTKTPRKRYYSRSKDNILESSEIPKDLKRIQSIFQWQRLFR